MFLNLRPSKVLNSLQMSYAVLKHCNSRSYICRGGTMGRCKFKDSWLEDVRFRSWLASVANPHHRVFLVLNFIQGGIKKVLKSLKFDLLKPADTLVSMERK